ncbi:TRAF3-interacting protein 1 [Liparis tanakae]|uniref:TRAF3-interacting protein 1 n=1 Tax=Liparis tanakae TaxID=230148 RepID=A0A4Z2GI70_9TELE|nr:TRAF3-interacting protein 1 [Liparis tanakae]
MDGKMLSEDEEDGDEQFIVEEAVPSAEVEVVSDSNSGLVKKILETKKDYESSPSSPKSKEQFTSVISAVSPRGRGGPATTSCNLRGRELFASPRRLRAIFMISLDF